MMEERNFPRDPINGKMVEDDAEASRHRADAILDRAGTFTLLDPFEAKLPRKKKQSGWIIPYRDLQIREETILALSGRTLGH